MNVGPNASHRPLARAATALDLGLAVVALVPLVSVVRVFAGRMAYPMDLEWCEGGSLYMAWRLLKGLPVYVKPGDVFAPFPYPPGHTLALALAGRLAGGLDFGPARAVSVTCFALLCATLVTAVAREFRRPIQGVCAGLASVGLVACAFPVTGGWYDLVRVDSMMIAFSVLAAALVIAPGLGRWRMLLAALAMTIAVYTKQTAAFFAAWICLFAIVRNWREGIRLSAIALALCGAALAVLWRSTHGQIWFWIFENLTSHPVERMDLGKGVRLVLGFAPFAPLLPVVFVGLAWCRRASAASWMWMGMLLVALPATLLPYAKHGGWKNDMIPVIVLIAPLTMTLLADLGRPDAALASVVRPAGSVALAAFIWVHPVDVATYIPDATLWRAAENLNAFVASLDGGVLSPQLAFLPARNGQTNPHWHRMGHADLVWSNHAVDEDWAVVRTQARYALINQLDRGNFGMAVRRQYRLVGNLPDDRRVRMLTGGGVVDLDQLWERLPAPGDPPRP
ncbi:MAG: DUF2029 domain-containing protein [Acidobacteria bacterium]|nr:DUF2029 domain-containing protein [Acidobacteriota bacterium]